MPAAITKCDQRCGVVGETMRQGGPARAAAFALVIEFEHHQLLIVMMIIKTQKKAESVASTFSSSALAHAPGKRPP